MTFYLIGLGLTEEHISFKAIKTLKKCKKIYLEQYTSRGINFKNLQKIINKKIEIVDRSFVEKAHFLKQTKKQNIALLIIGGVFSATTHIDLFLQCKKQKIKIEVIDNLSILTAIGITGLFLYKFGAVVSIPFQNVKSFYEVYKKNKQLGLHTLFLLDLNEKCMTINEALQKLISLGLNKNEKILACAGIGQDKYEIKYSEAQKILKYKFKKQPQCLIIPGKLHFVEEEVLELFK